MSGRDPEEVHRAATPLELLYDLVFVVAIARAAHGLHHAIGHGEAAGGAVLSYAMVFFAIWWAWMGFTWFASAFDTDDTLYRLKVLLQMGGLLVIAAGVSRAFEHGDWLVVTLGYAIMRVGLVAQWLRAARGSPGHRRTALRYATGLVLCQVGWISLLFVPPALKVPGFFFLVACELFVPWHAERVRATPWHPEHIAERYGLLTIIVIGESVLAATVAVEAAFDGHGEGLDGRLVATAASAPVILFAMWWLYFLFHAATGEETARRAFLWGYIHYFIFASIAAAGAGLALQVDVLGHKAHVAPQVAGLTLALPAALFLLCLPWHSSRCCRGVRRFAVRIAAVAVVCAAWLPLTPVWVAALLARVTAFSVWKGAEAGAQRGASG